MTLSQIMYLGAVGVATGIYLTWSMYFFIAPHEGRRYVRYIAFLCLTLFLAAAFELVSLSFWHTSNSKPDCLLTLEYMTYFFAFPQWAGLMLSLILPQKSNWWIVKRILLLEIIPLIVYILQIVLNDLVTYNISWYYSILLCIGLIVYCETKLLKYEKAVKDTFSDTKGRSAWWMHVFFTLFAINVIVDILSATLNLYVFHYTSIALGLALTLLVCFLMDYQQTHSKYIISSLSTDMEQLAASLKSTESSSSESALELTLAYSGIARKLKDVFESQRLYLEPDITSHDVAGLIGSNERYLSYFLNNVMGKNFHTYIKELRVEYAKILIESRSDIQLSDVAYQSGFNSPNTFASAFKTVYNVSPRLYQVKFFGEQEESVAEKPVKEGSKPAKKTGATLNERERLLCDLVMQDKTSDEIAATLNISKESLRVTKSRVLKKLDPDNQYRSLKKYLTEH